jgi:hypothetical protein
MATEGTPSEKGLYRGARDVAIRGGRDGGARDVVIGGIIIGRVGPPTMMEGRGRRGCGTQTSGR